MSVRIDGDSLSLRNLLGEKKKPLPVATSGSGTPSLFSLGISAPAPAAAPVASTPTTGLKFDLNSIKVSQKAESVPLVAPQHAALRNAFDNQRAQQTQQDILRITATCDDLASRLKTAQHRAVTAETNLQRSTAAFMQERQSSGNRLRAVSSEIEASRALEKKLRDELARSQLTVKSSVPAKQLQEAMIRLAAVESSRASVVADMKSLNEAMAKERTKMTGVTSELVDLHSKNTEAATALAESIAQRQKIESELVDAREEHSRAVSEAKDLEDKLKEAVASRLESEAMVRVHAQKAEEAEKRAAEFARYVKEPQSTKSNDDDPEEGVDSQPEKPVEIERVVEKIVEVEKVVNVDKVVHVDRPYSIVDAVAMHTKYNMIRSQIAKESHKADASSEERRNMISGMVNEARSLKAQYELIFGAPDDETVRDDKNEFDVFGDAPVSNSKFSADLHNYSTSATFGAAMCLQSIDSDVSIGDTVVPPVDEILEAFQIQESLLDMGEEVATGEEDINGHDSTRDMVRAVVRDLAVFMKNSQELRPLKDTINPTHSKDPERQPSRPPKPLEEEKEDDDRGILSNT